MRVLDRFVVCLVGAALAAAGCEKPGDGIAKKSSDVDFSVGSVQGTITYDGAPLAAGDNVYVSGGPWAVATDGPGHYLATNVPTGDYTVAAISGLCNRTLAQTNLTVAKGQTTTADFDVTPHAGRVVGSITVNGAPLPWPNLYVGCGGFGGDGGGLFSQLLGVGGYTADVYGPSGKIGSFSFTVEAGKTTDLGAIGFDEGAVQGTITYDGLPLAAGDSVYVSGGPWAVATDSPGHYVATNVPTGDYAVAAISGLCNRTLAQTNITVAKGQTTTADFDITPNAGRVVGSITVNGTPLPWPNLYVGCGGFGGDGGGLFSQLLGVGGYTADVYGPSGKIGSFSFTVEAGKTTDLGAVNFDEGSVQGTITYKGAPLAAGDSVYVSGGPWAVATDSPGHYVATNVPIGDYTAAAISGLCNRTLAQTNITVAKGQTTTADFDITPNAGRVVGSITVNGAPLPWPNLYVGCGGFGGDGGGLFSQLLGIGAYTADVYGPSGKIGSFSFTVLGGQTTDVDIGTTPAGMNVLVDLSGGIGEVGGLSLDFSTVSSSGTTTVVESGAGPPPPTGFRIVGLSGQPRYWDINTTATYSGPIQVCIHYDPAEVHGNEANLRLVHDDGSGWQNITTTRDPVANVICGTATSLSPFAVVEVDAGTDADGDGVADAKDRCAATPAGVVVDANGCSLDQLVPCAGAWKNHGAYVSAFVAAARKFRDAHLIDGKTFDALVARAGRASCGGPTCNKR